MLSRNIHKLPLAAVAGLVLLGACTEPDAAVRPAADTPGGELFARYVALGNSITAGFQSGGINDSTQLRSYAVLLAQQAGVPFGVPLLNRPGCPPPLVAPFSQQRLQIPGVPPAPCALRVAPGPRVVQNLAVPGSYVAGALDVTVPLNPPQLDFLHTFILGGRTQVEAMMAARPTLVTAWLGNNDALLAAVQGNPALLTGATAFQQSVDALAAGIRESGARDAVLIGVVNTAVVPLLQPGAFFWLAAQDPQTRDLLPPVNANCAPGTPGGSNLVSVLMAQDTAYIRTGINCSNTFLPNTQVPPAGTYFPGRYVLTSEEATAIGQRVVQFNQTISAAAQANGWLYVDPNPILEANLADRAAIRKCQDLPAALQTGNPQLIAQAVANSCPSPSPAVGFGNLFSFDGVHPSTRAHRVFANALIEALNARHPDVNIPALTVN